MKSKGRTKIEVMPSRNLLKIALCVMLLAACDNPPELQPEALSSTIDTAEYHDRLMGMWLGSAIANWTGLLTEGVRNEPPFYTDEDWGQVRPVRWDDVERPVDFVFQDPWLADDDTDIEYVYLHLMHQHQTPFLTAEQIAAGWEKHINHHIWVSNAAARGLIEQGAKPPVTGMLGINKNGLAIDAQLTTEFFGAMAPGMTEQALDLAHLPIRTTATGYAAHAAEFYVLLYSLASQVNPELEPEEQILWMVEEARKYIPDSSKTADVVDFLVADYLDNPDKDDWEQTRDKIYKRYQRNAAENDFVYRDWFESSVNFGAGLMALLYGEGDFKRTVQIGTLSGWDSDNGTSSMAGVIGLMLGYEALMAQFPDQQISGRYYISRSRDEMPDYLPDDPEAEDTFEAMASRMIPLIERVVISAGGEVEDGRWIFGNVSELQGNSRSQNGRVLESDGSILATVNGTPDPTLVDGLEFGNSGREVFEIPQPFEINTDDPIELTVLYDRPIEVGHLKLVEGSQRGLGSLTVELFVDGEWVIADLDYDQSRYPTKIGYELLEFWLTEPVVLKGIRIVGKAESGDGSVSFLELDSFSP